jgi:hypothetical protein
MRVPASGLLCWMSLCLVLPLSSQQDPPSNTVVFNFQSDQAHALDAEALVKDAQGKIIAGNWDEAQKLLSEASSKCSQVLLERYNCSALVEFAQGYFWQQKSSTLKGAERTAALDKARQSYSKVIQTAPGNASALNNLAAVEASLFSATNDAAKRSELLNSASNHWKAAMGVDLQQLPKYAVELGDFLTRAGKRAEALGVYQEAAARSEADLPRRRIVENARMIAPKELLPTCNAWRSRFTDPAIACYESVFSRGFAAFPDLSREAFTSWAYLLAHTDQMSQEQLAGLPPDWTDSAVTELRQYWTTPLQGFRYGGYWLSEPKRAAVAAEFVSAACREIEYAMPSKPQDAATCLERFVEPQPDLLDHLAFASSAAPLDEQLASVLSVYRQLLSLYARFPDKFASQKSERLIREIFQGKWQAIVHRNWRVTQDFHAALAAIYVERGIWSGPGATNALYQLKAVIEDGDKLERESEGAIVNSQPDVQQLLAKAYLMAAQKAPESGRPGLEQQGAAAYVEAARDYLDYDAFGSAKAMLEQSAMLNYPVPSTKEIAMILNLRQTPSKVPLASLDPQHMPALFQDTPILSKRYLARQRFKLLSDIAVSEGRPEPERLEAALRAYQTTQQDKSTLLGIADVVRWQRTEGKLLSATNVPASASMIAYSEGASKTANAIQVNLPGERRPGYIAVSSQTAKIVELVKQVGAQEMLRVRKYIYFQNGEILVMHSPDYSVDPSLRKVEEILGPPKAIT